MLAALWFTLAVFEAPLTAAAIAGAAVSVPIIIHLLNRRRFKIVSWAAMRFLLAAQRKNSRRMRLEQLLLLAVRCLVILLLILAMCSVTPWAEAAWRWLMPNALATVSNASQRTHKVLVIDGSVSMGVKVGEGTAFSRARSLASQLVRESPRGDSFSVVLLASPPRRIVAEPSEDARKVAAEIDALRLPHGNADLPACLNTVDGLLQASPEKFPEKEVYFFTDLQKSTWNNGQLFNPLPRLRAARTILVDVGVEEAGNIAVTNLTLADDLATTGRKSLLTATLHNYSNDTRKDVGVKLLIGKARAMAADPPYELRTVEETRIPTLERNQDTPISFGYKFPTPGDYVVQVQVETDNLPPDDVRSMILTVKKDLPVLLVNGKSFGDPFDQSAEWLRLALNPFAGPAEGSSVVRPKMINAAHFADETQGDLGPYDCVFLCDLPSLSLVEKRRLDGHLRRGGGVVFCLGGQVQAGDYNRVLFADGSWMLPAPLINSQGSGNLHQFAFQADDENAFRVPPLKAFQGDADRATLQAPRFTRFWQTGPPPPGARPRRILSFAASVIPGKEAEAKNAKTPPVGPAILEWSPPTPMDPLAQRAPGDPAPPQARVRGRVVMLTTGVNSDWGNWPASPSFPALMQELLYFASAGRLQEQSVEVGQGLELYLPSAAGVEATIETPDGRQEKAQTQNLDDGSVLRWTDTDISGIYRVVLGQHPREYFFAVNVPAQTLARNGSESDLARTSREELQKVYPDWEMQVVGELKEIVRNPLGNAPAEKSYQPLGPDIAGWMLLAVLALALLEIVLAFVFGHYTSTAANEEIKPQPITWAVRLLAAMPWLLFVFGFVLAGVLIHDRLSGDFLGFLGEAPRRFLENLAGIPAPAVGEGSHWRLENSHVPFEKGVYPWLAVGVLLAGAVMVWFIYLREGQNPKPAQRMILVGLRVGLLLLLLTILVPQLVLHFERQGWPDVVLLIDDSQSMSAQERHTDAEVREAADGLAAEAARLASDKRALARKNEDLALELEKVNTAEPERPRLLQEARVLQEQAKILDADADALDKAKTGADLQRLHLLQALTTRSDMNWLVRLAQERKIKLHIYHCSTRAAKLGHVTTADDLPQAANAILGLTASPSHDASQLGAAVRQVINDFRGSSLSAVIMLTDGVTTEGEDLPKVSKYAAQMGVPLYFVGVGDAHEVRDLYLHDLQAADSVYKNDTMYFDVKVTARGYKNLTVPVVLREKGQPGELDRKMVQLVDGKEVRVTLRHQPREAGERIYVIDTPIQEDEAEKDNNRLEKAVSVRETKLINVLYVEGYRRYEYHFLKTLLERESDRVKGNKTLKLHVLLLDADPGYVRADRSALSDFPTRKELDGYDVVILGDVDPSGPKMEEHLKDIADFVKERGGGLVMIAGERYSPAAYGNSPLKDVLPVEMIAEDKEDAEAPRLEGYHLEMTPAGRLHPIFRLTQNEKENDEIWAHLREMYWWADGYAPKRAAEVLAVHPTIKRADRKGQSREEKDGPVVDKHPLVVQQFVGSGRSLFLGFGETWRWGHREDQQYYNNFWIQTVRYMARSRLGRIELKLDRQTNYRRGEPIKVTVRFPDDSPPPPKDSEVKVVVERKLPGKEGQIEFRTIGLARLDGSRTGFEAVLTQTPEGEYQFWLSAPVVPDPKPRAECKVVAPPGEMYGLRMNQPDMEAAADETHGRFYNLATADQLLQDLQVANRVTVSSAGKPLSVWNHVVFFLLALALLTTEWLLRKRMNLL